MTRRTIYLLFIAVLFPAVSGCWPEADDAALWDIVTEMVKTIEPGEGDPAADTGATDGADPNTVTALDDASLVAKVRRVGRHHFSRPKAHKRLGGDQSSETFELGDPLAEHLALGSGSADSTPPADCETDGSPPTCADNEAGPQITCYRTKGHAGRDFTDCLSVKGRIGKAHGKKKKHTFELALRPHTGPAITLGDFDFENGVAHAFVFVWDGSTATFQVDDAALQGEFECDSINAIQLRTRAKKGTVEFHDLKVNGDDLDCSGEALRGRGNDLHNMRIEGDFADGIALSGTVRITWKKKHAPKKFKLDFEIILGVVPNEIPEPPVDCNENGVPDDEDLLAGTSADCNADGVPDECQADTDGDGTIDACDACPQDPDKVFAGACGCGVADTDADEDGVFDCDDLCPETPVGVIVDSSGCEILSLDIGEDITLSEVAPVQLQAEISGGTPPYSFWWSAPDWEGSTEQNPIVMPTETTTYTVTVSDSSIPPNVLSDTLTVEIETPAGLGYAIVNLGSLSSSGSYPAGINDHGQVVGYYRTDTEAMRAFLYSDGAMIDLGTLGGADAYARDINNAGQVVGEAMDDQGRWRAFWWDSSDGMHDLGTLGGATSAAYAINESGQVSGFSDNGTALHAFLYSDGVMSALDTLDYYQSGAFDINDAGQMSGVVVSASGAPSAVVFDGSDIFDLGAAISGGSQAWNINNSGMVTGYAWGSGAYRSFLYAAGQMVEIGALEGFRDTYVYGLNDAGQAAGIVTDPDTGLSHAFLYSGGVMIDLNDLLLPEHGWEYLTAAFAVNSAGQIAGYGQINGQFCGFLLTPVP